MVWSKSTILFLIISLFAFVACQKNIADHLHEDPLPEPIPGEKKWIVTTVAGNGNASYINGAVSSATFNFPEDVVVTSNGTIYVTDVINKVIRKIANAQVSTLAGNGDFEISDGNGVMAGFKSPYSITIDANGYLYTTDENDPRIRRISPNGDVITYVGIATPGFSDGDKNNAQFKPGNYIIADALGNLYISDAGNHRIRKIDQSGQVSTIAGSGVAGYKDGNALTAQFNSPGGLTIDKLGNLFIVDKGNFRVRKISSDGVVTTVAGNGIEGDNDGINSDAQFNLDTRDIVADESLNLYLTDRNKIRKISSDGLVTTIAGSTSGFQDGEGLSAKFNFPNGLSIDNTGKLYVADLINNRIRKISFE